MQHPYAQDYDQQVEFGAVDEDTFADMVGKLISVIFATFRTFRKYYFLFIVFS